jgi:hypothetical protein
LKRNVGHLHDAAATEWTIALIAVPGSLLPALLIRVFGVSPAHAVRAQVSTRCRQSHSLAPKTETGNR